MIMIRLHVYMYVVYNELDVIHDFCTLVLLTTVVVDDDVLQTRMTISSF